MRLSDTYYNLKNERLKNERLMMIMMMMMIVTDDDSDR